ncbi:SIR2 family protein [Citricoccus nitrophenolicus]|uniref:SIR2 family protein n=1 Tax=Citricoccus nitrophenolicus TaxID=863575 RepID=A0ABV0IJB6_9MICC
MHEVAQDAVARLTHAVVDDPDRRVTLVVGSGVSRGLVPGTEELTKRFLDELGAARPGVEAEIKSMTVAAAYARASERMKLRLGPRRISAVIRRAVLEAAPDYASEPAGTIIPLSAWKLNPAHEEIANLYELLPPSRRGPILTTNFDPLIEVALERRGIPTTPLNLNDEARLNLIPINDSVPVVHLHGHWSNGAVINTNTELDRLRPSLEAAISDAMRGAVVWVMGYSGWTDSFARALEKLALGTSFALLESEICWITHGSESVAKSSNVFASIVGTPGVTEYVDVNAAEFLQASTDGIRDHRESVLTAATPAGWSTVPQPDRIPDATPDDVNSLMDGAASNWTTAKAAPLLSATLNLREAAVAAAGLPGLHVIAAVGPTGEGKSLALRQAALAVREGWDLASGISVWYRDPGSPIVDRNWIERHLEPKTHIALIIDDADLILEQVVDTFIPIAKKETDARIVLLLGLHEHELHKSKVKAAFSTLDIRRIQFEGPTENDAFSLAYFWRDRNLLPDKFQEGPSSIVAGMVYEASQSPSLNRGSLFASILELWEPLELLDRVHDLLERVDRYQVKNTSLSTVLLALALVDTGHEHSPSPGLTLNEISLMLELNNRDILPIVIKPLGREAGITFDGETVHMRHPAIARALMSEFEGSPAMTKAAALLGTAAEHAYGEDLTQAQVPGLFAPRTSSSNAAAQDWARAMINSSGNLLRSRVTFLATHRRTGNLEFANKYSTQVENHIEEYDDWSYNIRGFYCEWALTLRKLHEPSRSLNMVMRALADRPYVPLFPDAISHAFDRGHEAAGDLSRQGVVGAQEIAEIFVRLQARHEKRDEGISIRVVQLVAHLKQLSDKILGDSSQRLTFKKLIEKLSISS